MGVANQEVSGEVARFNLRLGKEPKRLPYGMFFHGESVALERLFTDTASAERILDKFVADGQIPETDQVAIRDEIRSSGLPEKEPYLGPFSLITKLEGEMVVGTLADSGEFTIGEDFFSKTDAMEFLDRAIKAGVVREDERAKISAEIDASALPPTYEDAIPLAIGSLINAIVGPPKPKYSGPYSIRFDERDGVAFNGAILSKDGDELTTFNGRLLGMHSIKRAFKKGLMDEAERDSLLKQIEESSLPERFVEDVAFQPCGCRPDFPHGYFNVNGEQTGNSVSSVSDGRVRLMRLLEVGMIDEARIEEVCTMMREAGLPESIGD